MLLVYGHAARVFKVFWAEGVRVYAACMLQGKHGKSVGIKNE